MPEQNNDAPSTLSRRAAITAVAAVPLSAQLSVALAAVGDEVAQLVKRAAEKNAAFMRGDMDRWFGLAHIAPDFTLMQPFGGPASHGFDASPERLAELARFFKNGESVRRIGLHQFQIGYPVLKESSEFSQPRRPSIKPVTGGTTERLH